MKRATIQQQVLNGLQSYNNHLQLCQQHERPNWTTAVQQTLYDGLEARLAGFDKWVLGVYQLLKGAKTISYADSN
jgi:hypothetical protein